MSTETKPANGDAADSNKPKRKKRWVLKIAVLLFVALLLFVLLVPTLISTGPGTRFALSFVNSSMPGRIEVRDLSVGWFSGTKLEGVTVTDPAGTTFIVADVDAPDVQLLSLATGSRALGTVTVNATQMDIVQYDDGTTNLDRTLGPSQQPTTPAEPTSLPSNLSAKLRVTAPQITYTAPQMDKAIVSDLDLQADIDSPQAISAVIAAKVQQGAHSSSVSGSAKIVDAFDAAGVMQASKGSVDASFAVDNLSTALIGALAKQGDTFTHLAGPEATVTMAATGRLSDLSAQLSLVAQRMKMNLVTQVAVSDDFKKQTIRPQPGQLVWLKITPQSHAALTKGAGAATGKLVEPFEIAVTHENVALTSNESGPNLLTATGVLNVAITPIRLDTGAAGTSEVSELDVRSMRVAYDGPKGLATALIEAVAKQGDKSGTFLVKADLNKPFDAQGDINYQTLDGTIDGQIKDFAMGVVDDIIGTQGLLTSVLGERLNANALVKVKPAPDGQGGSGTITLTADSPNKLDVDLNAKITANPIANPPADGPAYATMTSLTEPATVKLFGAQRTLNALAKHYPQLENLAAKLRADDAADIVLTIGELSAPLDASMAKNAMAKMAVNVGGATFDLNPQGQTNPDLLVRVTAASAGLSYSGPKNQAVVTADIGTMVQNKPGKLTAVVTLDKLLNREGNFDADALVPVVTADVVDMPTALADAFIDQGRLAHYGIGPTLNANITTTLTQKPGPDGKSDLEGPVKITAKAENLDVLIDGRLQAGRFTLPQPEKSFVTMTATAALVEDLKKSTLELSDDMKDLSLAQPAKMRITFTQLDVPLDPEEAKKSGRFGLTATIDQIVPTGDARLQSAAIRNLVATLKPTTLEQPLLLTVTGDLIQGATIGKIDASANITRAMREDRDVALNATFTNIPTPLVDALGGQGGLLVDLFGNTIERMALSLKPGANNASIASYDFRSQFATGTGTVTYVPDVSAAVAPNSKLVVNMSPQGFAAIQRKHGDKLPEMLKEMTLVEPAVFDVTVERAQIALAPLPEQTQATDQAAASRAVVGADTPGIVQAQPSEPLPVNAKNSSFKVNVKTRGPFLGKRGFESAVRLENLNLDIFTPQDMTAVALDLKADTAVIPMVNDVPQLADAKAVERGMVSAQITAKDLADKNGRVSFADLGLESLAVNVKGQKLPVGAVDKLMAMDGKLVGLLGPMIDEVTVISRKDGDVVAHLESANAKIDVTGLYTDRLSLTGNAVAFLHMNEILSNLVFEPMTGGILSAERSEKPVHIVIQKEGFSAPVGGFDIAKLNAKVDFDFNSMKLKPLISVNNLVPAEFRPLMAAAGVGGALEAELGSFLGKFDDSMPTFNRFSASIENGVLRYSEPMTFKIDKYTMALDGTVNLKTKVPNLALGFPKAALSGKLQKFLGNEGFLYVPFTQQNGKLVPDVNKFAQTTLKSAFSPANLIPGLPGAGNKDGKPDLGGLLEGILGKDDKKKPEMKDKQPEPAPAPEKTPPKNPETPAPPPTPAPPTKAPEKSPMPPTPPTKVPEKTPTPPAPAPAPDADPIQAEVAKLVALSKESPKKAVDQIEAIAKTPKFSSVYILAHATHQLSPGSKPNLIRLDTRDPRWAAYEELKRIVSSSTFDRLCSNYLTAAALGGNTDQAHAEIISWLKENESKFAWSKDRFRVKK